MTLQVISIGLSLFAIFAAGVSLYAARRARIALNTLRH